MAMRRRKTLVICRRCHEDIHAGRAIKPYPTMITGKRGAGEKSHAPSRKRPTENDPAIGHLLGGRPLHSEAPEVDNASGLPDHHDIALLEPGHPMRGPP